MLNEDVLKLMDENQRKIVLLQQEKHLHEDFEIDFDVSGEGDVLKGFFIQKGVWDFLKASGRYHARYMFYHNTDLFVGKTAIEIGTGTGIMSIVMAKYGAKKVIASDISGIAVKNAEENVKRFGCGGIVEVIQGDLFENIKESADCILWMIPFFPGFPQDGDTISASMIMDPALFERFLNDAKKHLNPNGVLVICSYSLGGKLTDPVVVGAKLGYSVKTTWQHHSINGIQQGMIYMHELRIK